MNPNNNNTKHYQVNNNKEVGKDTAVVDFNKSKEKGEERIRGIIEQLADLSFEERFIEQILKDFSLEKIEEKLELLMAKRNIQNPAGWLRAALKYDYQDLEKEKYNEEPVGQASRLSIGKCRGTMHRAQGSQKTIKHGGHNPLCPYKIIKTVSNNVIAGDRRKRGNLNLQLVTRNLQLFPTKEEISCKC